MDERRPNLGTIRSQYQVPNDVMIKYRPRLLGSVDIPFMDSVAHDMTQREGELLDRLTLDRG